LQDGLSKIEPTGPLRSATLGCDRNLFEFRAAFRRETCNPRFLRMQAEKCLRSALTTSDLGMAADLKRMARDLEGWANDAEFKIQRVRRRPLLESSIALH
jgi:hypothetical protein